MKRSIIYQVEEKSTSDETDTVKTFQSRLFCDCVCQMFSFFRPRQTSRPEYQIEIDSPKNSGPSRRMTNDSRKALVLDLDETLVHSSFKEAERWDFTLDITVQNIGFKIFVSVRPGAKEFIEQLAAYYDIILFTASLKEYADPVMDILDPGKFAVQRLFREHCLLKDGQLIKDLKILNRDLADVIIIDNSDISFRLQPENAFHIKDYYYDQNDKELPNLVPFLQWISGLADVRPIWQNKVHFDAQLSSPSCKLAFDDEQNQESEKLTPKVLIQRMITPAQGRFKTCQSIEMEQESINEKEAVSPGSQSENLKKRISTVQGEGN